MGCSFLFLRRLLIVGLVGVFVSVNTFIGETIADDNSISSSKSFSTCTLIPEAYNDQKYGNITQPTFQNQHFLE
ncbi:MAG: hypothetical protein AAF915_22785 [Cyanobacteria bacterium P01_D01_bin.50]